MDKIIEVLKPQQEKEEKKKYGGLKVKDQPQGQKEKKVNTDREKMAEIDKIFGKNTKETIVDENKLSKETQKLFSSFLVNKLERKSKEQQTKGESITIDD
jgi:hypothetical protein